MCSMEVPKSCHPLSGKFYVGKGILVSAQLSSGQSGLCLHQALFLPGLTCDAPLNFILSFAWLYNMPALVIYLNIVFHDVVLL